MLDSVGLNGPMILLAVAWKSLVCNVAAVPKKPFLRSTIKPWKIESGLPPPVTFCFLSLSVTAVMVALSGMLLVLNDRMPRYCFLFTSSPRLTTLDVLLSVPPALLFSDDSRIQPSCAATEVSVMVTALDVGVRVTVLVGVAVRVGVTVSVRVTVGEGV